MLHHNVNAVVRTIMLLLFMAKSRGKNIWMMYYGLFFSLTRLPLQYRLKSPDSIMFSKKNDINPMDDETSAEFLMAKNDCALMAFGSHNKKRSNNLILVRFVHKNSIVSSEAREKGNRLFRKQ